MKRLHPISIHRVEDISVFGDRNWVVERERVVAVGLLSERELAFVGHSLRRVYRIDEGNDFDDLLRAIDEADCRSIGSNHQAISVPGRA